METRLGLMNGVDALGRARSALHSLDPSVGRDEWVRIAMAVRAAGLDEDDFHAWSALAPNYAGANDCRSVWRSIKRDGGITANTLFHMARKVGWHDPGLYGHNGYRATQAPATKGDIRSRPARNIAAIFERCSLATADHPYIASKRGVPEGLRVVRGALHVLTWRPVLRQLVQSSRRVRC